jgi:type IV secretion system protein VirB9
VCIVELQPGEKIVGEPQIGDSVRWNIAPAMYGSAADATWLIVLKPQMPGLDTNLLITTDRRAYYMRLVSRSEDYVSRVAFAYPDDESNRRWQQQMADERSRAQHQEQTRDVLPAMLAVENLNFDYNVTGKDEQLRPVRVYDDGAKTYIQMRSEMQHREAPVLLVIGNDGKGEMTNYRVRNETYIVDRLFDRAELVLGAGKKAQGHRVEIAREKKG